MFAKNGKSTNRIKMLKNKNEVFFFVGGVISIIGAISSVLNYVYAPYLFSLGALILVVLQVQSTFQNNDEKSFRQKRLVKIQLFSSLLLVLASYFMFTESNAWVVAVLIYGLTQFFLSFRSEQN